MKLATFHERIYQLYEEARDIDHKIGRIKFSEMCEVSRDQMNGWLNQDGAPDMETLKKVAKTRGVSTSWLVGETDIRNSINFTLANKLPPAALDELNVFLNYLKFKYLKE